MEQIERKYRYVKMIQFKFNWNDLNTFLELSKEFPSLYT